MTLGPGIEPGTHWWEASALTTAPSLLSRDVSNLARSLFSCEISSAFTIGHFSVGDICWQPAFSDIPSGRCLLPEYRWFITCTLINPGVHRLFSSFPLGGQPRRHEHQSYSLTLKTCSPFSCRKKARNVCRAIAIYIAKRRTKTQATEKSSPNYWEGW